MIHGHGGNKQLLADRIGCAPEDIIDMSANLNPLGPPKRVHDFIRENIYVIHALPEPDAAGMSKGFADYQGIDPDCVIAGNGTTFFIYALPLALGAKKALILGPTYADYEDACAAHHVNIHHCLTVAENNFVPDLDQLSAKAEQADLVFICNPNNPTGTLIDKQDLETLIHRHPGTCFMVDESYLPFVPEAEEYSLVTQTHLPNLVVLSSMSKIFRIPGLRTGFLTGAKALIQKIMVHYQPWSVNALAQAVIKEIYNHPEDILPFYRQTRAFVAKERRNFVHALAGTQGIRIFDAPVFFVLAQLDRISAAQLCRRVGDDGFLIRDCSNFKGLSDQFVRFSLKTNDINQALAQSIKKALAWEQTKS
ncbi:threonine-phosphate decarboxylase [uncultured Desulfobacter sp.]|uniref:threonine-phosphate decarboxylase n=1 Tax=uncultured Desulfobacter sp. TaxID=240139 RepID=UPI0029F46C1B|nr:threonine-phosphate decarboxylase [uncultured Desulfobacter sp.]